MPGSFEVAQYVKRILDALTTGLGLSLNSSAISLTNPLPVVSAGQGLSYKKTLTVTNGAYTINDVVGGAISLTGLTIGKRYVFHTLALGGVAALAYHLWFFETDIATPAADNAASTMVAADIAKCLGVIPIAASDYSAPVSAFNVATLRSLAFEFVPTATSIVVYMLADAVTSPGTDTLTLRLNGEQID